MAMRRTNSAPRPLDPPRLERLALRYVERFATTQARLAAYLTRKIRERGWEEDAGDPAAVTENVAERMVALGYVDDLAFGEARAASMTRRGLGARRVQATLKAAGLDSESLDAILPGVEQQAGRAALKLARRRRIGPYAAEPADRALRERHAAVLIRGGHAPALAWRIAAMPPGDPDADPLGDDFG